MQSALALTQMHWYVVLSTIEILLSITFSFQRRLLRSQVHTPTNYSHLHKKRRLSLEVCSPIKRRRT